MIELKLMSMPILTLQEKNKLFQMLTLMMLLLSQKILPVLVQKVLDSVQLESQVLKVTSQDKLKKLQHQVLKEEQQETMRLLIMSFQKKLVVRHYQQEQSNV